MFSFADEKFEALTGGIVKYDEELKNRSHPSNLVFLYVDDIEEWIVVGSILPAGLQG